MKIRPCASYVLLSVAFTLASTNRAAAAVMAFWDFGSETVYTEEPLIDHTGGATILLQGGVKDFDGKNGVSYIDADGGSHLAGKAAAWDNVNSESELIITVNTSGWRDMILRWDYSSENTIGDLGPASFDLHYRIGPTGTWVRLLNNEPFIRDGLWHSFAYTNTVLLNQIENNPFVQFRLSDLSAGDESGGDFKIDNVELTGAPIPGSIALLWPNGGENLMTGNIFDIQWQTTGTVVQVKLEYSLDGGAQWAQIATVPNIGGHYGWEIPDANSLDCLVRASNLIHPQVFDISDAPFRIFRCLLNFDLNGDCYVDLRDLALLASEWLLCGDVLDPRCL
ncbi:MAG: hypothetical protein IH624_08320 [Phycisphaerae bacterium]|nr:hypothetical protein [Phycisphaerae bacterium]